MENQTLENSEYNFKSPTNFNLQRLVILVISIFGILTLFMPWISAAFMGSAPGISQDGGVISLILFIISAIIAFIPNIKQPLKKSYIRICAITGIINLIYGIFIITQVSRKIPQDNFY